MSKQVPRGKGGKSPHRESMVILERLADGFSNLPPPTGAFMAQAATVCMDGNGHSSGVVLEVDGSYVASKAIHWSGAVTDAVRRAWNDPDVAAEWGAYGVAILLLQELADLTVVERARKGSGFDWWLGKDDNLFQEKARLEVSGMMKGDATRVRQRTSEKMAQTRQSDDLKLAAFIVVVEFGTPRSRVVQR